MSLSIPMPVFLLCIGATHAVSYLLGVRSGMKTMAGLHLTSWDALRGRDAMVEDVQEMTAFPGRDIPCAPALRKGARRTGAAS